MFFGFTLGCLITLGIILKTFIIVPERSKVIKERLGKFDKVLDAGFHFLIPFVDRAAYRQEVREQIIVVPSQSCITKDNIQVDVDGFVYVKVTDARKASYGIGNYVSASVNLAQTTMRSEIGKLTLDQTFTERDAINENIVQEIDKASAPWGIKMIRYEIMNINPSRRVVDTMEKQMEAERQKRADITISSGEKEAKINLSEGAKVQAINLSEGVKLRRINEASGTASEIRSLAAASAQAISLVAQAINTPGGQHAVKAQLVEQFIDEFGKIVSHAHISVVPNELANIQGFFQGMGEVSQKIPTLKSES